PVSDRMVDVILRQLLPDQRGRCTRSRPKLECTTSRSGAGTGGAAPFLSATRSPFNVDAPLASTVRSGLRLAARSRLIAAANALPSAPVISRLFLPPREEPSSKAPGLRGDIGHSLRPGVHHLPGPLNVGAVGVGRAVHRRLGSCVIGCGLLAARSCARRSRA